MYTFIHNIHGIPQSWAPGKEFLIYGLYLFIVSKKHISSQFSPFPIPSIKQNSFFGCHLFMKHLSSAVQQLVGSAALLGEGRDVCKKASALKIQMH